MVNTSPNNFIWDFHTYTDTSCSTGDINQASYVDALEALCGELAGGEIRPALRFAVFQPGDVILEQGSPAMYVGVMARGHAVVKVDGAVVGEIRSGELFGEMSFLTGQNRTASVEATKVCECQFTTHQDFARLIQARPSLISHYR